MVLSNMHRALLAPLVAAMLLLDACGEEPRPRDGEHEATSMPSASTPGADATPTSTYPEVCLRASQNVGLIDELAALYAQIDQRLKLGDQLDVPRQIDHSATFPRPADAASAARRLDSQGYRANQRGRTLLVFHRDAVDLEASRRFVCEVYLAVDRNRGDYEGWGSMVVESH